jgi:hypothetical protein
VTFNEGHHVVFQGVKIINAHSQFLFSQTRAGWSGAIVETFPQKAQALF